MKLWLSFSIFVFSFVPEFANAQFSIAPILDRGPIRFGLGVEVELNRFGPEVVASATTTAVLRNAQNTVVAALPQLNKKLLCSNGNQKASITSLNLESPFGNNDDLVITLVLHVRQCALGLYEGDVQISVPISLRKKGQSIVLVPAPLTIVPLSVSALGFLRVSDAEVKSSVNSEFGSVLGDAIRSLNSWVASKLREPSVQMLIKQYQFEIQSAKLVMQGSDLALLIKLSSQMSIVEADRRFSNFIPF